MIGSKVPVPRRMKHLPRDHRGYPVPVTVLVDQHGHPHFAINDDHLRERCLVEDLCPICGGLLGRKRWFVGGPRAAFHEDGAYVDPPMHDECCHYALQVCPYLAAPSYAGRIDDRGLRGEPQLMMNETMIAERPELFVAVLATGQTGTANGYLRPVRPYVRVEFWRKGVRLDAAEGSAIAGRILKEPMPSVNPAHLFVGGR